MYYSFMDEYVQEALREQEIFLGADPLITEKSKEGVYKENFYFRDHLQLPKIHTPLSKPKNRDTIVEFVGTYMDEHSTQLSTAGPVYSFTFNEQHVQPLYDMFELKPDEIINMFAEMVKETYDGKIASFFMGWVKHAPHKIMITSMLIDAIQNNYEDIVECCEYMWAFCEYALLLRKSWPNGVKEETMKYTIEHLGSKFQVTKVSNLKALLYYDSHSSVVSMEDRLRLGDDSVYADFMQRMRNQIKNKFKNIAREYYKYDQTGATQHTKSSQFDDGSLADQEGFNTNISQVIDKTVNKFATGTVNSTYVRIAADGSQADKDNLMGYLNQIYASKGNRMNKLIENVITAYFNKYPTSTSVGTGEFVSFGIALYRSIGTSKDPLYQEIKEILAHWTNDIINITQFYQSPGTIINYTRALYNYVVFMIAYYN